MIDAVQKNLYDAFLELTLDSLKNHPFHQFNTKEQIIALSPHYLGLSTAFPYLQAGAQLKPILNSIHQNQDIPEHVEITSVVGNFLCWDETGGSYIKETFGMAGLSKILDTRKWFHANLLRKDLEQVLGFKIIPDFSSPTKPYLISLYEGLSASDPIVRCAYMVAFETHAKTIIEAFWHSLGRIFGCDLTQLFYFTSHIHGENAAELHHIAMVREMLDRIVSKEESKRFLSTAIQALSESLKWAEKIGRLGIEKNRETSSSFIESSISL